MEDLRSARAQLACPSGSMQRRELWFVCIVRFGSGGGLLRGTLSDPPRYIPSFQSSRKDFFARGGRSREFVQALMGPGTGLTEPSRKRGFCARRPALVEILYRTGLFIVFSKPLKAISCALPARPFSTCRWRSLSSRSCSGIPTG